MIEDRHPIAQTGSHQPSEVDYFPVDVLESPPISTRALSSILATAIAELQSLIATQGRGIDLRLVRVMVRLAGDRRSWAVYNRPSPRLKYYWQAIEETHGNEGLVACNKALLCSAIVDAIPKLQANAFPPETSSQIAQSMRRVLARLRQFKPGKDFEPTDDIFLKDLGICTLRLLPAEWCVIDTVARVPYSLAFRGQMAQFVSFLKTYLLRCGGHGPFFANHFHPDLGSRFTQEGRRRAFLQIADLMRSRTEIKGLIGTSWYYDPAVAEISPHLDYVRRLPLENNAAFFKFRPDDSDNALARSTRRRRLYSEGKYVPMRYVMIWARRDLLTWASSERAQITSSNLSR